MGNFNVPVFSYQVLCLIAQQLVFLLLGFRCAQSAVADLLAAGAAVRDAEKAIFFAGVGGRGGGGLGTFFSIH